MRLIDADKLERQYIGYRSGRQELVVKATKVDEAPTVDAIPIAWLKEQAEDTTYQHRVDGLIERWRRKHETY